jgi:AraC-like DNA-binding protein
VGEVALLLGFSKPGAFHRAFKRWYKMTPQTFRKQQNISLSVNST